MWKLLRNSALAAILLAGTLKLLAWYAVGQDAQRVVAALTPYAQVKYDGLSAGLDGSVSLSRVTVAQGSAHTVYRADSVELESPGLYWLLKHALLHDDTLPAQFGISVQGLKLPAALPWLDPQWLNPTTFVPFETLGCGSTTFSAADYEKMNVAGGTAREHAEYRYDTDAKTLDLTLTLSAPAFANVVLEAELRQFDPQSLQSPAPLEKLHIGQLSADYADSGFLQRRNQFCAQRAGITPRQFAERHLAAVQDLLKQHGIEASGELSKLYRQLVEQGGQASILSLPNNNFVASAWPTSAPDDLLRQLNVTARYRDTPPVMFRLSFAPPPETQPTVTAAESPSPAAIAAARDETASSVPPLEKTSSPEVVSLPPPMLPIAAPAPANPLPVAPLTAQDEAGKIARAPPLPTPSAVKTDDTRPVHDNLGLHYLDRAEAKLMPPALQPLPSPPPVLAPMPEFASSAAPPPDSTLALVWKPTIERLPEAAPQQHDYSVIDYASLKNAQGRRVRLITDGGKKVEGDVLGVDDSGVHLRINRAGGAAQFVVPQVRIRQVQLLHLSPPA